MEPKKKFIPLYDLDVYRLARRLSSMAWEIYQRLTFQQRKVWGAKCFQQLILWERISQKGMLGFTFRKNQDSILFQERPYQKV